MPVYLAYPMIPEGAGLVFVALAGLNVFVLLSGYGLAVAIARLALKRRGISGWTGTLLTMPAYWLLMSVAAWYALWQFIAAPFHWNKTEHGLSKLQHRVRKNGDVRAGKRPRGD